MKYYIVTLTQHDGEHEHVNKFVAYADSTDKLNERIKSEQFYDTGDTNPMSLLDYGDGITAVSEYYVWEISGTDYNVLKQYLGDV